jgi:hypothetical protein
LLKKKQKENELHFQKNKQKILPWKCHPSLTKTVPRIFDEVQLFTKDSASMVLKRGESNSGKSWAKAKTGRFKNGDPNMSKAGSGNSGIEQKLEWTADK